MAIIHCPMCNARVSDLAERCACGQPIRGASAESLQQAHRRERNRTRGRLKLQLLLASTLFVAGALWTIAINVGALGGSLRGEPLPLVLLGAGGLWYLISRGRLWWLDR